LTTTRNRPAAVASGGPGTHRWEAPSVTQHSIAFTTQLAEAISFWAEGWDETARQFLSGFFHDTLAGHAIAVDMKLGREDFPRNELWQLAHILGLCALADIQHPCLQAVLGFADEDGTALCGDNDADLAWLETLEASAAGCAGLLKVLKRYARRKALIQRCYQRMCNLMGSDGFLTTEQPEIVTRIMRRPVRRGKHGT